MLRRTRWALWIKKPCGHEEGYRCLCRAQEIEEREIDVVDFMTRMRNGGTLPAGERVGDPDAT